MVGSGPPAGLTDAMATLFGDLLGRPPTAARTLEKLTVRFGYRVVAGTTEDPDGVVVLSPVTFRPAFPYDAGVPATLTSAVQAWLSAHAPAAGVDALVSIEVAVLSARLPDRQQPLVELRRLDHLLR